MHPYKSQSDFVYSTKENWKKSIVGSQGHVPQCNIVDGDTNVFMRPKAD